MRVLIVEDDVAIARVVKRGLEQAGFQADIAQDGVAGFEAVFKASYNLIVLDIMLPRMDGFRVCEELRKRRVRIPILMLTARGAVDDRVKGLDTGADDYLPKPFDFNELLARIRALLRRDKVHKSRIIQVADLEIDTARHIVTRAGVEIGLSHREYDLLEALASREGYVLTREMIQERVWMDDESYSNTVDVYIGMLRKKIDAGHEQKLIQTIRGVGYSLRVSDEGDQA